MVGGCAAKGCPHRAPQPSVPSGEAVTWAVRADDGAIVHCNRMRGGADDFAAMVSVIGSTYEVIPVYAAPPQDRVSEVTREMIVDSFTAARGSGVETATFMAKHLTAALSAGRGE
jgi:hypothetical protein